MDYKERIARDNLKRIAREHGPVMLFDGEVIAVDTEGYFCDVQSDIDPEDIYQQVRLRAASIGNQSIDILPAIGSEVVIAKIAEDDYILIAADEISSYRVTVGEKILTITDGGFSITDGTNSLKDILSAIITQMLAIYAPKDIAGINAITVQIDGLLV